MTYTSGSVSMLRVAAEQLGERTIQIDVAVAWITSDSLVQDLLQFVTTIERHRIRVISGYDDYLSSPGALRLA